jgi:amidohydrolase
MDPKSEAQQQIAAMRDDLIAISHKIHANPEIGGEEVRASGWLADALSKAGFTVQREIGGLPTAFLAQAGKGPLHVAFLAEYDALPDIGHACGHNIIAAMALGAGIAAARVADAVGLKVSVVGTPAEEAVGQGGKVPLLEKGVFEGVHAALMVHPAPFDVAAPKVIAAGMFEVNYTGKEAHASAFPEHGINAADALTVAQTAIGLLRQHILPTDRIHGIITKGGDAPNVIPAHTRAKYMFRSETLDRLEKLRVKVRRCFEAGALATGCTMEITASEYPYAHMRHDPDLVNAYRRNAEALGRTFPDLPQLERVAASTDMGNVSLAVPAMHPMIGIGGEGPVNHQPEFTAQCVTEAADKALIDGATAMVWTAIDIATDEKVRERLVGSA